MTKTITLHSSLWKTQFAEESRQLQAVFGRNVMSVHHIGSTAISNILAKPIIDILVVVRSLADIDNATHSSGDFGYEAKGTYGIEGRRYFRKTNARGIRTHHIHMYEIGSAHITRHIAFRDYLRAHPDVAEQYSAVKAKLADADGKIDTGYQAGKGGFVKAVECDALEWACKTL